MLYLRGCFRDTSHSSDELKPSIKSEEVRFNPGVSPCVVACMADDAALSLLLLVLIGAILYSSINCKLPHGEKRAAPDSPKPRVKPTHTAPICGDLATIRTPGDCSTSIGLHSVRALAGPVPLDFILQSSHEVADTDDLSSRQSGGRPGRSERHESGSNLLNARYVGIWLWPRSRTCHRNIADFGRQKLHPDQNRAHRVSHGS